MMPKNQMFHPNPRKKRGNTEIAKYGYEGADGHDCGGCPRFRRSSAITSMLLRLFSSTGFVSTL